MSIEKEVFELWKELSPSSAFASGLKEYAGQLWIPSHANIKHALLNIKKLRKRTKNKTVRKFLNNLERTILFEEPHHPPGEVSGAFFTHLILNASEKHYTSLAEQSLNFLGCQQHLWTKTWPVELQIFSAQECAGAIALLDTIKKQSKRKETKDALTAVQKQLKQWKEQTARVTLKKNDYTEIYPLLKRRSKGLGRKNIYPKLLKDFYDFTEKPERIEQRAVKWIDQELPTFKQVVNKLSKRYQCKPTVEHIEAALSKHQGVKPKNLLKTVANLRKVLHALAEQEWIRITPKYDVRVIETPPYLVPFLPTAAMQSFNSLTKPFCLSFVTTDPKASPSTCLPDVAQTIIHEEYGHCVNFLNSYHPIIKKPALIETLGSSLEVPITEGISFNRELESLHTFHRMSDRGAHNDTERKVMQTIEKYCPFEEFVDGITFVVYQWRMVRFLRAISDVRLNLEKQTYPEFIEWAHKKTGLSKKLIYDQTIHFQEHPGYAPCYSILGQKLNAYQKKARKKGTPLRTFNTYAASIGFPARSVYEQKVKNKFNL